jgi:hypothetical protein
MRALGNHRGARTIGLALLAGLVAFEGVLMLSAGALGVPGLYLIRLAAGADADAPPKAATPEGGESVIAKLTPEEEALPQTPALPPAQPLSPVPPDGPLRLEGLGDIPLTPWPRDEDGSEPGSKHSALSSGPRDELPWDAVEPVPYPSEDSAGAAAKATAALPPEAEQAAPRAQAAAIALPASSEVEAWIKAKATEVKGMDRARPLYHFEFWVEPPDAVKRSLAAVTYDFNTPAVMPQSQASSEEETGFRVSAGGLACADRITVTLRFKDGRSQRVAVDGCKLLS